MIGSRDGSGGPEASDPFTILALAARDMWLLGATAMDNFLAEKRQGQSASLEASFEPLLRAASDFRRGAEGGNHTDAERHEKSTNAAELLPFVAQAYLLSTVSAFRYWRGLAETYGAHQSAILQSLAARTDAADRTEEAQRILIDELRAYLREVGDVSVREARVLQAELEKLAADVARSAGESDDAPEYRRYWKCKT